MHCIIKYVVQGKEARVKKRKSASPVLSVFKIIPEGKRSVGKPRERERWRRFGGVENDLKIIRGWRITARDVDAWKVILNVARDLHGP